MPITAKLCRQFYERLGDDVANELVDLLNTSDAASRQEIGQHIDTSLARLDERLKARFAAVETRLAECATKRDLEALKAELLRWMFLFWVGTMGTVVAILKL